MRRSWLAPSLIGLMLPGCTSFSSVRPAEVIPGIKLAAQLSIATPPGDLMSWFFSFDCAEACDHSITGADLTVLHGWKSAGGSAFELGVGYVFPVVPYIEGYAQLNAGAHPIGLGGRLGIPLSGWTEHRFYVRTDLGRVILSPTLFLHTGASPNGQSRGSVTALVQSVGLKSTAGYMMMIPTLSIGIARIDRTRYEERMEGTSLFAILAVNMLLHKGRE